MDYAGYNSRRALSMALTTTTNNSISYVRSDMEMYKIYNVNVILAKKNCYPNNKENIS